MKERALVVIDISEIAARWQIPVERVQYFITDCDMDPAQSAQWFAAHSDLVLEEKKKAFEAALFPEKFRTAILPPATLAKTS